MKNKLVNFVWALGIRTFRLARRAHISSSVEPVFAALARLAPPANREVAATLPNGATLVMPAGYRDTRTVVTGLFQSDETKLFARLVRPGMTFLDIGAYVGYFTVMASDWVGSSGHVYAFEPDAFAYQFLIRNVELNNCVNAVALNRAVSDGVKLTMLVRDPNGPETFLTSAPVGGNGFPVETVTLDSFLESEGWPTVNVAKMNIEGSELFALRGMREISRRSPNLQLVMEFNPAAIERARVSRQDLNAALTELGFRRGQVVERDLEAVSGGQLLPKGSAVYNVLLTK